MRSRHWSTESAAGDMVYLSPTPICGVLLLQPQWYSGLMLLAPMISLDKVKQRGLNPILM